VREKRREAGIKSGESRKALSEQKGTNVQHRSNTVEQRSNTVEQRLTNHEHLPTNLPTNSRSELVTYSEDSPIHQSTEAPAPNAKTSEESSRIRNHEMLLEPNLETVYIFPAQFQQIPLGAFFVPSGMAEAERKVFVKFNEEEFRGVKVQTWHKMKQPEHIVFTYENYTAAASPNIH
jgi:hypothetical protein